ncbi:Cytochrome c oxidase assembly protein cox15 [Perkinsus olseni]|uniref:Cytochrome c oxidase assembly protein cox15 n=1 Tax=Perkinsus olseni TaxID=32597 RepID=A0A7J6U9P8_PEROL|nr:Cytochrome c oxidase assembly protein cox15 [Perkinsus olseni]
MQPLARRVSGLFPRHFSSATGIAKPLSGPVSEGMTGEAMKMTLRPWVKSGWEKPVGYWLLGTSGLLAGMVLVGGYTRLSGAGLSMTNWKFQGSLPPNTPEAWEHEFLRYQEFPEYKRIHKNAMTVDEFKEIYLIEWFHRMLGRGIGIFFGVPFMFLSLSRVIKWPLGSRLGLLLGAGATQGLVGWWMVRSGLEENPDPYARPRVSSYRMCFHWLMALVLYGGTVWCGLSVLRPTPASTKLASLTALKSLRRWALIPTLAALITLTSGPFVAGLDAGRAFNTWPKMIDDWVPDEAWKFWGDLVSTGKTQWLAATENTAVVQFNHRCLAYTTVISSVLLGLYARKMRDSIPKSAYRAAISTSHLSIVQMLLGISTLLMYVPTELGVLHQGGGLAVYTALIMLRHACRLPLPVAAV